MRYKFKVPNLLEVVIIFALLLVVVFGWMGISHLTALTSSLQNITSPEVWEIQTIKTLIMGNNMQVIFLWLILIALLLNAAILEGIREKL